MNFKNINNVIGLSEKDSRSRKNKYHFLILLWYKIRKQFIHYVGLHLCTSTYKMYIRYTNHSDILYVHNP